MVCIARDEYAVTMCCATVLSALGRLLMVADHVL
jgi:hypothetical protein